MTDTVNALESNVETIKAESSQPGNEELTSLDQQIVAAIYNLDVVVENKNKLQLNKKKMRRMKKVVMQMKQIMPMLVFLMMVVMIVMMVRLEWCIL
ncbi:hypothetical protein HanIR_Chr16g0796551 [Helianthus annuus]|nr:hypothetical protein HanIR_Chr16g0796551 [Helianthus annuus]